MLDLQREEACQHDAHGSLYCGQLGKEETGCLSLTYFESECIYLIWSLFPRELTLDGGA